MSDTCIVIEEEQKVTEIDAKSSKALFKQELLSLGAYTSRGVNANKIDYKIDYKKQMI